MSAVHDPVDLPATADACDKDVTVEMHRPTSRGPQVGRLAAIGFAIGFVVVTAVVAIGGVLAGQDLVPTLGVGMFVGYWGGGGFGFMLAVTVPLALHHDAQRDDRSGGDVPTI